jgi:hypothetical protein
MGHPAVMSAGPPALLLGFVDRFPAYNCAQHFGRQEFLGR